MGKFTHYPNNPELNRYAAILSSMTPAMVDGIITLVNLRGRGLVNDLFAQRNGMTGIPAATAKPLAMFSPEYIQDGDFEDVYRGVMTLLIAQIRKPRTANDEYQALLKDAFNIPSGMAESIAKKIETEDILKPLSGERTWLDAIGLELNEAARTAINWAGGLINSPWEIDQKQNYDFDFLYEMKALGAAVEDLNSRASLISAQSMINAELSLFQMEYKGSGDIDTISEHDKADMLVGDIFGRLRARKLPSNIAGGLAPLSAAGDKSAAHAAKHLLSHAGYHIKPGGQVSKTAPKNPFIKQAVDKMLNMKPSAAMGLGAAMGLTPMAINALKKRKGDIEEGGDLYGDVYSDISTTHGNSLADAWAAGDIEDIFKQCLDIADEDHSTGDPELDAALDAVAMEDMGDAEEIGGPFRRFRVNMARRQASRASRKAVRKDTRQRKKNDYAMGLSQAKLAKSKLARRPLQMAYMPEQDMVLEDDTLPNDDAYDVQESMEPYYPGDNGGDFDYGIEDYSW